MGALDLRVAVARPTALAAALEASLADLGAAPTRVVAEVVGAGMRPVAIGAAAGLLGAFALSRTLAGFLHGVSPADPASHLGAGGALLVAGLLAALWPGWRAGRVDPVEALRAG